MLRTLLLSALVLTVPAAASANGAPPAAAGKEGPGDAVVRMKKILVPVIADGRIRRYESYDVAVEMRDATKLAAAQQATPRLQDAMLGTIHQAVTDGTIANGEIVKPAVLSKNMQEAAERALESPGSVAKVTFRPSVLR